jgi:hypothetical protein
LDVLTALFELGRIYAKLPPLTIVKKIVSMIDRRTVAVLTFITILLFKT